jgi:TRAP-type C4-dicarboxylate transport system substrate-binding protein
MKTAAISFACLIALLRPPAARADEVVIKLGTLAPSGSTWHTLLKEMGQRWSQLSGGKVKLRIYPGGIVGNEGDMVKKMRVGQLQAAALTTVGLHEITPEPQAIDAPMLVDSWPTLDYVISRVGPELERALAAKGYVVISWSEVGFVRFFSSHRYASYEEMKQAKVFGWEGDPASARAWRAAGFHPVVISSTDIVPSLETGLIDTVALAPLYAFSSRIFERARYMLDLRWAVLTGASVVKSETWDKIPADLRVKLIDSAREYAHRLDGEIRRMDSEALDTMRKQGLEVVRPADPEAFRRAAQASYSVIRGQVVPAAIFDEVKKLVAEAHAKQATR